MKDLLQALNEIAKALGPVTQAYAIYDCEVTKENAVQINYGCSVIDLARMFGEEAGPVIRWYFKLNPSWDFRSPDEMFVVAPINRYGSAIVMSQAMMDELLLHRPFVEDERNLFGPKVYDLNKEARDESRRSAGHDEGAAAQDREDHGESSGESGEPGIGPSA